MLMRLMSKGEYLSASLVPFDLIWFDTVLKKHKNYIDEHI